MATSRRGFGAIRKLPSKRYQTHYVGPYTVKHLAPHTFDTKEDAEAWLSDRRREISNGAWGTAQAVNKQNGAFGPFAEKGITERELKPRTRAHYRSLLDAKILPKFADIKLVAITAPLVREWHSSLSSAPRSKAHAYGLLRTVLATAVEDELIPANPCHIQGAGTSKRAHKIRLASLTEITSLVQAMPAKYKTLTLLTAWCGLRFGELVELRRDDVDAKNGVLHVRRGVVRADGNVIVGKPKSDAGIRDVAVPPHLMEMLKAHIAEFAQSGRKGLLFPRSLAGTYPPARSTRWGAFPVWNPFPKPFVRSLVPGSVPPPPIST